MKTIRQIREAKDNSEKLPQIYCDMDMVLVDFLGGANRALADADYELRFDEKGQHDHKDKKWAILNSIPKFWLNLEPMPDGLQLWNFIKKYDAYILSTPSRRMPSSVPEKKAWIKKHLGGAKKVHLVPREDKQKWATTDGEPNILIDDYIKNIKEWEAKGGIGIHHTSTANTIRQLKKLGF
jgi:5'(3')-deoxyribonucleotidase